MLTNLVRVYFKEMSFLSPWESCKNCSPGGIVGQYSVHITARLTFMPGLLRWAFSQQ